MWEPVGPLPAAVYWRRRCVALASAVVVVGLVIATAGAPTATPVPTADRVPTTTSPARPTTATPPTAALDDGPTSAAVSSGALTATGAATEGAPDGTGSTAAPDGTAPAVPGTAATSAGPVPQRGATGVATPGPFSVQSVPGAERIRPDDTPRPSVAAQSAVPVPASGPVPCTNAMLSVVAELDHPVHRVGSHPVFRLVITDVSGQPCVRDLDSARQEIVVWSADGATRLWSSNDCVNAPSTDLRTLVPGRPVAFAVTWGERTTTPGCRTPRTPVPPGSYRLMVRLDNLISAPTPFIRTS